MDEQTSVECGEYLAPSYIGPGATYTYTTTRNIGTTWTTGGFLSIDTSDLWPVSVQAGFFSSFAETTTTGDTSGLTSDCGNSTEGSFTCGMHVVPRCWQMSGTRETEDLGTVVSAKGSPRSQIKRSLTYVKIAMGEHSASPNRSRRTIGVYCRNLYMPELPRRR